MRIEFLTRFLILFMHDIKDPMTFDVDKNGGIARISIIVPRKLIQNLIRLNWGKKKKKN